MAGAEALASAYALLDAEERRRAAGFRGDHLARRFILRHAARRIILGTELGREPGNLRLGRNAGGKPHLIRDSAGASGPPPDFDPVEFNDTDSGDHALVAVTHGRPVGVDLELHPPLTEDLWETRRLFAPGERTALEALAPMDRSRAFFDLWTRKEAILKALGTGLQTALDAFEVPPGPLAPTGTSIRVPVATARRFRVWDLRLAENVAANAARNTDLPPASAALAMADETEEPVPEIHWRTWTWGE